MISRRVAGLLIVLLALASLLSAQESANAEKGKQLFSGMCSRCHGLTGAGGEGPNLNRPVLTHATDDATLATIIREGIPNTGMPRIRRMTDPEVNALVAYVRSLGRTTQAPVNGDRDKGQAVYAKLGCSSCHTIAGTGGTLGPELTSIGSLRAPDYLRQAILDPAATLPKGVLLVPGRGFGEFLPVAAVTQDGREVRGVRVNEDSFTIQIRDAGNQLYSFRKADLRSLDKEIGKSVMPSYRGKVSDSELNDLIAYLWEGASR